MYSRCLILSIIFILSISAPLHAFRTPWNQEFVVSYSPTVHYNYLYPGGISDEAGAYSLEYNLQLGYQPQHLFSYFGIELFWARGESGLSLDESEYARKRHLFPNSDDDWTIHPSIYQILVNFTLVTPLLTDYSGLYFRTGMGLGGGTLFQNQSKDSSNILFAHASYGHVPYAFAYSFESGFLFRIPFLDGVSFPDFPIFINAAYNNLFIEDWMNIRGEELYSGNINLAHIIYSLGVRFQF